MERTINEDLDQVVKWSKMNTMVISQTRTKCYCMLVVGKRLQKRLDNISSNLNISLNGAIIDQVLVFILTKILTLTFKRRFYINRYQRKLVFSHVSQAHPFLKRIT